MISQPVDIAITTPMKVALLNADENNGRIVRAITSAAVIKALHRRGLVDSPASPSYLTDDGRTIARQIPHRPSQRTFTVLRSRRSS